MYVDAVNSMSIATSFSVLPSTVSLYGSANISSTGLTLTNSVNFQWGKMLVNAQFPYPTASAFSILYNTTAVCGNGCADGIALVIGPYDTLYASSTSNVFYESSCPTQMFCVQQSEYSHYFRISVGGTVISSVSPSDIVDGKIKSVSVTFQYSSGVTVVYKGTQGLTYTLTATSNQLSALSTSKAYGVMIAGRTGGESATHTLNAFSLESYMVTNPKCLSPTVSPTNIPTQPIKTGGIISARYIKQ